MVLQHIARGGAAQSVVLARRNILMGLVGLIAAPGVVKAESLMPIAVWKPSFMYTHCGGMPDFLRCRRDDLIDADLDSLGLPPPSSVMAKLCNQGWYWIYRDHPLASLPLDKVRITNRRRLEGELSARRAAPDPDGLATQGACR